MKPPERNATASATRFAELHNRGAHEASLGRLEEAARTLLLALEIGPTSTEARTNLGLVYGKMGRTREAASEFQKVLAANPGNLPARRLLGIAHQELGELPAAAACFEAVAKADPGDLALKAALAALLLELGRPGDALPHFAALASISPDDFEVMNGWGLALNALGRPVEAVAPLERAVALRPDRANGIYNLGCAFFALGRFAEAATAFERASTLKPDWFEPVHNLGLAHQALGRPQEAAAHHRKSLLLNPASAEAHNSLGVAYRDMSLAEQAIAEYERAVALKPDYAEALHNLGSILTEFGRLEAAHSCFEKALALDPRRALYHRSLANASRFREGDPRLPGLENLAREIPSLPEADRIELHFALGKAYQDLDRQVAALEHIIAGSALQRKRVTYDEAAAIDRMRRIALAFTTNLLREKASLGEPSPVPVFIVGMPRSGTSLVEQVLASHPDVHGAGELKEFESAAARCSVGGMNAIEWPETIARMGAAELRAIGSAYVKAIRGYSPDAARITDKLPGNFLHVGLIRLALPGARIIHVRRDPVDTCLSCFSQLFTQGLPFTYDLRELGRHYVAYERLMTHWRSAVEPSAMMEVRYEDLVGDLETHARRMVDFCGLNWDARCLSFHDTRRLVKTASMAQVRQPLYTRAVGRSRAVSGLLGPLLEELGRRPEACSPSG